MAWYNKFNGDLIIILNDILSDLPESTIPLRYNIFRCFDFVLPEEVKVIIVGQDPYPLSNKKGEPYADGLSFSSTIKQGSLLNIEKALIKSKLIKKLSSGRLDSWAQQGILMLNRRLTLNDSRWDPFTACLINWICKIPREKPLFICLWGQKAKELIEYIPNGYNIRVLEYLHPSPMNNKIVGRKFEDCDHFSKINEIYNINWEF